MAETDSRINIIYASNDGYAGHLAASLCSLLDHNRRAEHIDIYVFVCRDVHRVSEPP